jgi:hypothetical protein
MNDAAHEAEKRPVAREHGLVFAAAAMVVSVAGTLVPIPSCLELYNVPAGSACRPMGTAAICLVAGIGTPACALTLALLASLCGARISRRLSVGAVVLSFIPLPVYWLLFRWIVAAHHLVLKP